MGNEGQYSKQVFSKSRTNLNKSTSKQKIQAKVQKSPVVELIYIPETGESVVLTESEYRDLLAATYIYDQCMKDILAATKAGNKEAEKKAKDKLAAELSNAPKSTTPVASTRKLKTLAKPSGQDFVEVVQFGGRKYSFVPRDLADSFRSDKKVFVTTGTGGKKLAGTDGGKLTKNEAAADLPDLRTEDGKLNVDRIKKQFLDVKKEIQFKYDIVKPKSDQISVGHTKIGMIMPDDWIKGIDKWIADLNQNLTAVYNDREERKKALIELLTPKNKKQKEVNVNKVPKQSKASGPEDTFDEKAFGKFQTEVEHIWDQSELPEHQDLVVIVTTIKWDDFQNKLSSEEYKAKVKSGEFGTITAANRDFWKNKIQSTKIPEYIFNATANAQFMRYAYGVTTGVNFDPISGKFSANLKADAQASLFEGKVNATWVLPSNEGAKMELPFKPRSSYFEWQSIKQFWDHADTFEIDKSFLLPSAFNNVNKVINDWKVLGRTYTDAKNKLQIIGHADAPGTDEHNKRLSKRRSQATYELMIFHRGGWYKRFESGEWGDREMMHMLNMVVGATDPESVISNPYWTWVVEKFQKSILKNPTHSTPTFVGIDQGCHVSGVSFPINRIQADGKIGTKTPSQISTLYHLIDKYMRKGTNEQFLVNDYFRSPPYDGKGETDLIVKTDKFNDQNRRVSFHLTEGKLINTKGQEKRIPLGYIRLQIEAYLTGFVGANAMASAELVFSGYKGDLKTKGANSGEADVLNSTTTSAPASKEELPEMKVDDGLKATAGAFAGAEATAGLKAGVEWKCPDPIEPEFVAPNHFRVPHKVCGPTNQPKTAPGLLKEFNIKEGFVELASAGYSVTGSVGIGIKGEFQIGFDRETGKFLIKAQAKATLGYGAGGAFEFAVSAKHVYFFIRFVHAQLNDHNFNFVDFMDDEVFEIFSAWSYKLLQQGNLIGSSAMLFGMAGIKILSSFDKLIDDWRKDKEDALDADALAELVNNGNLILKYMAPEVKGKLLHRLCVGEWFDDDKNKEQAIVQVLETIVSEKEYQEVLEHMGGPLPKGINERNSEKASRIKGNPGKITRFLDNEMDDAYHRWLKKLPKVAPKIGIS